MMILFGIGLVGFANFVPPLPPSASAAEVVAMYRSRPDMILVGMVFVMTAAVLFIPFFAAIGFQMVRIEGRLPILGVTQMLLGIATAMTVLVPSMFFAAAAFRVDRDPQLVQLMNDLGWITLMWPYAPAFVQMLSIAICVLSDKAVQPLFPRWIGFFNIWMAILMLPGAPIPLFHSGPFAWNGLLAFWVAMNAYFLWLVVMAIFVTKAIKRSDYITLK